MEAQPAVEEDDAADPADAVSWPVRNAPVRRRAHERSLIDSAIRLVATSGAPSVTVVGIRGGRDLLAHALGEGARSDVVVRARWWAEGGAFDLVVERHG